MLNVIGIGDNVCDKYLHLNKMFPGGQALNFSVFSKMMGYNSAYLGVFGSDKVAEHIIHTLSDLKIDISHCRYIEGENGYAEVNIVNGERVFVTSNKGGVLRLNNLQISNDDLQYLSKFHIIHTSNNSYIDSQLRYLRPLDSIISYDFSTSWSNDDHTKNICKHINFAFMSCSDKNEEEIKEQLISTYEFGTNISIATRGTEGSVVYDGNKFFVSKPDIIQPIDTLGAGDSFATSFLTSFIQYMGSNLGKSIPEDEYEELVKKCLNNANQMSAKTCMIMGAFGYGTKIF